MLASYSTVGAWNELLYTQARVAQRASCPSGLQLSSIERVQGSLNLSATGNMRKSLFQPYEPSRVVLTAVTRCGETVKVGLSSKVGTIAGESLV